MALCGNARYANYHDVAFTAGYEASTDPSLNQPAT